MFHYVKWVHRHLRVFKITMGKITIRFPHVYSDEEHSIPFGFRNRIEMLRKSGFRAIGKDIIKNPFLIVNKDAKKGTAIFSHRRMNLINTQIDRKWESRSNQKTVSIRLNNRNRNMELIRDILISCMNIMQSFSNRIEDSVGLKKVLRTKRIRFREGFATVLTKKSTAIPMTEGIPAKGR